MNNHNILVISMVSTMWLMEPNLRFNFPNNHTSFILYWPECNCQCFYCDLNKAFINCIPYDSNTLELSLPFIDCITVSGGEPLLVPKDVFEFQKIAKEHNKAFYVYTNGYGTDIINKLLKSYNKTKIVIDIKGNNVETVQEITKINENLSTQIYKTYEKFKECDNVIFRINDLFNVNDFKNFKNIEIYKLQ